MFDLVISQLREETKIGKLSKIYLWKIVQSVNIDKQKIISRIGRLEVNLRV